MQRFPVPSMGDSISEGTILELAKNVGDYVAMEEVVATVETDKVTVEIRSPAAGTVTAMLAQVDETVLVGSDLIEIDVGVGTATAAAPAADAAPASAPTPAAPPASVPQAASARIHPGGAPSLIDFCRRGAAPAEQAVPAAAAAPPPAPTTKPVATQGEIWSYAELPARFRRAPLSAEEMEAVDTGMWFAPS